MGEVTRRGNARVDVLNGRVKMEKNDNSIIIIGRDGSRVGMGEIPNSGGQIGFFATDADNNVVWKRVGVTEYTYNPDTGRNIIQRDKLPDGTYGEVIVKEGVDVEDVVN